MSKQHIHTRGSSNAQTQHKHKANTHGSGAEEDTDRKLIRTQQNCTVVVLTQVQYIKLI